MIDVLERIEAGYGPQRVAALREQLAHCLPILFRDQVLGSVFKRLKWE